MRWILVALIALVSVGCARISPLSPELENKINNQDGKIDDIRNNQNGVMMDLLKLKNEQEIVARDIHNMQQGLINKNNKNSGVQIFQGDGGLVVGFSIVVIGIILVLHYRSQAKKNQKVAEILAQQVALYDDVSLDNGIFLAAMNTEVEEDVYHLMVANQSKVNSHTLVE